MRTPAAMENEVESLSEMCMTLFARLCESKSILGLAYLMHAWPITGHSPAAYKRLLMNLIELDRWHRSDLQEAEVDLILQIVARPMTFQKYDVHTQSGAGKRHDIRDVP
jgi:hypothetical protein